MYNKNINIKLIINIILYLLLIFFPFRYSISEEESPSDEIIFGIVVIHATNQKEGYDERLAKLKKHLSILNFKGFFLLSTKEIKITPGKRMETEIVPSIIMDIELLEKETEKAKFKVILYKRGKNILETEFSIGRKGTMILGGPRYRGGVLLIPVTAWY